MIDVTLKNESNQKVVLVFSMRVKPHLPSDREANRRGHLGTRYPLPAHCILVERSRRS